jgi:thiamine-monophosphate kinase
LRGTPNRAPPVIVSELGERRLLARIRERLAAASQRDGLVIGIGDDAAIVAPARNRLTVLTTDAQIEGVHFERAFSSPEDIGHRALAVNLSDLAAMGAEPRWALLSLALPDTTEIAEVDGIVSGVARTAARYSVGVIGGNLTRSPGPLMVDITAVGETRPRRPLTRSGGRPGDNLFVSGNVGGAAAGLEMLRSTRESQACIDRYLRPVPRVRLGAAVAQARAARAAMDLSDGLADAVVQLAAASGCGFEIDAALLPIDRDARQWWEAAGTDPVWAALSGGDDYELLFATPRAWAGRLRHARSRVADPPLTRIGVLTKDPATRVLLRNGAREELPEGFEHWPRKHGSTEG